MLRNPLARLGTWAAFLAIGGAVPGFARRASAQHLAHTSWGDPDIQGVWNYGTMTPLQRPSQWEGIEILPEEEAVAYEQATIERRYQSLQTAGPDWWEPENNVLRNRRTALIVDPPDGRIPPLTEEAQAASRAARAARGGRGGGRYDNPEQLALRDRCIAWEASGPPMIPTVYNNNVEIVQSPDYVVLTSEMIHRARIVPTDGRPHGTVRTMFGDPIGHWEGNTLVIESINFDGSLAYREADENFRLIERFTPTSDNTLEYSFTVDDPTVWTQPWTVRIDMGRTDGLVLEFACHEGNFRSIEGMLRGARYEEAQQEAR